MFKRTRGRKKGFTEKALAPTSAEDSVVECDREKSSAWDKDAELSNADIMGVFNKLRELVESGDGTTRALVKAQAKEIRHLKAAVGDHSTILAILWEHYTGEKEAQFPLTDEECVKSEKVIRDRADRGKGKVSKNVTMPVAPWFKSTDSNDFIDVEAILEKVVREDTRGDWAKVGQTGTPLNVKQPPKRKLDFKAQSTPKPPKQGHQLLFFTDVTPVYLDGGDLPWYFPVSFRPPCGVRFIIVELAVGSYIFDNVLEKSEMLVPNDHCNGTRRAMWSLRPRHELEDDVVNLVASKLTAEHQEKRIWWLPTTFAQLAPHPDTYKKDILAYIEERFMGHADDLKLIYVPLNLDHHWYLMIVDICNSDILYLDSAKEASLRQARVEQINTVAKFLDTILAERRFYLREDSLAPGIRDFSFQEPTCGQQTSGGRDCGVWVCQWMELWHSRRAYELQVVTAETRYRMAVDLVLSKSNKRRDEICTLAADHWNVIINKNIKTNREGPSYIPTPDECGSTSSGGSKSSHSLTI
ncbi:hypothetical protein PIB30_012656 [Stylosanthes scabra]|uniref:Ubiquitin-like protease family profile domain-containing protein n=1 Tax=Stylosanthes scabra TaxID=79078 RepID=A0ABU6Z2T0_9FABA|nr:hypothetical protein [Stylosanthes scabra]